MAVLGWNAETAAQDGTRQVPRLVVNITIDQLHSGYLEAYAPRFSADGLKKLLRQGRVYENASYPMERTDRASAISSVITGTVPYFHGIVGEKWLDRETLRPLYACDDAKQNGLPAPTRLMVSTIGDELKVATGGLARVFAIAPFRDAAILAAGHAADGALWMDEQTGRWVSSQYYLNDNGQNYLVSNEIEKPGAYIKTIAWTPFLPQLQPDFKYAFKGDRKYKEYQTSGLINAHITELAMQCVAHQNMGADDVPDLLCLTYYAGPFKHQPVTECQNELEDIYLRLDRNLRDLITRLEERIGADKLLFIVSGTGYLDPEQTDYAKYRIPTGTFYTNRAVNLLNMYFGAIWGQGHYVEACFDNQLYVNHKLLEQRRISVTDFYQRARDFLVQMEGVKNVYTGLQLSGEYNSLTAKVRNGFHPQHSGDILIEVAPGWHLMNEDTGEDRVWQPSAVPFPIILYGTGIQPSRIELPVTADRIAPTIARAIRIRAPNACTSEPLF